MRDFQHLLDETAALMSGPLLELILADCIRLRVWAREHSDYAAATMFDVAIEHFRAEVARREAERGPARASAAVGG